MLGLVLLLLVFEPLAFGGVGVRQTLVLQGVSAIVLGLWVARIWLAKNYRLLWPPICWAVVLFMGYAVVRYRMLLSEGGVEYVGRQELILVLAYGSLFFVLLNNLSRQEATQMVSLTLIAIAGVISLYAAYQFLTKSRHVLWTLQYPAYIGRGSGTYVCPNSLGGFLEMVLPLALAYTLLARFKPTAKVFIGYAALAIFTGIGVSVSRGAWVATGFGLLLFFGLLMRQRGQRLAAIIFCLLLICAFAFFIKNLNVLQRRVSTNPVESKLDSTRLELWRTAYRMWQDHFWWGVGPAQFDDRFRAYRPEDIQMRAQYAHNDYLNALADWGLVGTGLIAAAFGLLYAGVYQSWKFVQRSNDLTTKRSNRSAFVLGGAAGLVALLAHSFVDFNMHIPANALVAITLMALISGHLRFATERFWLKLGWVGKPIVTIVCAAVAAYLVREGMRRGEEDFWLSRAERATELGPKLASLEGAYRVDPNNAETTYEIGETLRLTSWQGQENYRQLAEQAIPWFQRGAALNRFDPYNPMKWAMCLHWLDRPSETPPLVEKALSLDPNNFILEGLVGWHYFQLKNWDESERWFKQAMYKANWNPDYYTKRYETGEIYLRLIEEKRQEQKRGAN
jgi:O-antigen ligase